jgi:glycyl-tRNA synthetase
VGVERLFLALINDSYDQEILDNGETREVLHLIPALAPYKATILPLVKKVHGEVASSIYADLVKYFPVCYDESGSIGKRYRRSDAIGTPYAITIDDTTLTNNTVTIRNRDTMEQTTLNVSELSDYLKEKVKF